MKNMQCCKRAILLMIALCYVAVTIYSLERKPGERHPSSSPSRSHPLGTPSMWKDKSYQPYPKPTPAKSSSGHDWGEENPKEFLGRFYRLIDNIVRSGMNFGEKPKILGTPIRFHHSTDVSGVRPTPSVAPIGKQRVEQELFKFSDALHDLILSDVRNRPRPNQGSQVIRPTPTKHFFPSPQSKGPYLSSAGGINGGENHLEQKMALRKFVLHEAKQNMTLFKSFLLPEKVDFRNESNFRGFVDRNLPKIAASYWKFIKTFLSIRNSMPCSGDCQKIERMVEFCKRQHDKCNREFQSMSVRPTPTLLATPDKPCPEKSRKCPFQKECVNNSVPCINDKDFFPRDGGVRPTPSASMKPPMQSASRHPRPHVMQARMANESKLGFAWREMMKGHNKSMKPEDLRQTFHMLQESFGIQDMRQEGETPKGSVGKCSRMCAEKNMTFCWAEMRCKRIGAMCSPMHLAKMMNKSAFDEESKCKGSFFCPIFNNCTNNRTTCNPKQFIVPPCDEECMRETGGKGRRASPEDVKIFRLQCRGGDKYCPRKSGCIGSKDNCDSPRLGVPMGKGIEDEKRLFCRIRDYVCPRVYRSWMKMKGTCSLANDLRPSIAMRPAMTERPPHHSRSPMQSGKPPHHSRGPMQSGKPPHHSRGPMQSGKPPHHSSGPMQSGKPPHHSRGPMQSGKPPHHSRGPLQSGRPSKRPIEATPRIHHTRPIIKPTPTLEPISLPAGENSLPFVTLKDYVGLQNQIRLPGRNEFIVIASMPCVSQFNFKLITYRNPKGESLRPPQLAPSGAMARGVLVPLNAVLRYLPTQASFHGACLLKYAKYVPPRGGGRPIPLQVVDVPSGEQSGFIAMVILPKVTKAEVSLGARDHIEIDEDTKNPPCFKVSDLLTVTRAAVSVVSGIPANVKSLLDKKILEEYRNALEAQNNVKIQVAVISCKGHPWTYGTWKIKDKNAKMKAFPNDCSVQRPFVIDASSCVAFYPRKDVDGNIRLGVVGAIEKTEKGKRINILGKKIVKIGVNIKSQPDEPELSTIDTCLPSLPFDLSEASNAGFKVEDIIRYGKLPCGIGRGKDAGKPLMSNFFRFLGKLKKIGLAFSRVSECREFGHWEFKSNGGAFQRVTLRKDGLGLCLNASDAIRFVPVGNYSKLWSIPQAQRCAWVKTRVWAPMLGRPSGPCNMTSSGDALFSRLQAQLSVPRKGCDDVVGSMIKPDLCGRCGKKKFSNVVCPCDGVPGSGAVIDECGRCSGGTTGRLFHKRDCARKCYQNGTVSENAEDDCGRCQKRRFMKGSSKDCNGDCTHGRNRACINKCGICVGGKTGKPYNQGINNCGVCIANASSVCSRQLTLVSAAEVNANSRFLLKIKAAGFSSLRSLTCSLQKVGGSAGQISIGRAYARSASDVMRVINPNSCQVPKNNDFTVQLYASVAEGGDYDIKCKINDAGSDESVTKGRIKVTSSSSSIQGLFPPTIGTCKNGSFIIKGSGFRNTSSMVCAASCERRCDFKTSARFINESAVACNIKLEGHMVKCNAQRINLHVLTSSAVRPPPFSSSSPSVAVQCNYPKAVSGGFSFGVRRLKIKLDKPASFHAVSKRSKPTCQSFFDAATARGLGRSRCYLSYDTIFVYISTDAALISGASGSNVEVTLNRDNLRCRNEFRYSVLDGSNTQRLTVALPNTEIIAKITGLSSIGSCDRVNFNGIKSTGGAGGKIRYSWELLRNGTVVLREDKRSWLRIDGRKLSPDLYTAKLCVRNVFGKSNCKEKVVMVIDNKNSTMSVRIPGEQVRKIKAKGRYFFRPFAKLSQCGRSSKRPSAMKFLWEIIGQDGAILKNYEGRNLRIKEGDLLPGKNYTLKVVARAILDGGDVLSGEASVTVEVQGSKLKAKIRGGKEMTVGCNDKAIFDARTSSDPDKTKETARYSWECTEEGDAPCFKKSDPTKRLILEEKNRVELDVKENLECNKSYVFKLTYSKGERQANYNVKVTLKPGEPAEVKLDQRRVKKKVIVIGYIKTKSNANSSWSCIDQEGYDKLDCSDASIVRVVRSGKIGVRRGRPTFRRHILVVDTEVLPEGEKYLIQLTVDNGDGTSKAQIVVASPTPPTKGDVVVEPTNGTALNTSFTIFADEGWAQEGEEISYEFGYEMETPEGPKDAVLKPFSDQNFLEGVQLPPGNRAKNRTVTVYVKARNSEGMTTKAKLRVLVREPEVISQEEVSALIGNADQAIKEKDFEKANRILSSMAETAKSVSMDSAGDASIRESLTQQALSILEQQPAEQSKQDILITLQSTTDSSAGLDLLGETRERVALATSDVFLVLNERTEQPSSRRRRRSVEGSQEQGAFTPKTQEEVDSAMTIFDNIIEENTPGSFQDNIKMNFTSTVPSWQRSLCASVLTTGDYLVSKNNLSTIRSNRLSGYTFDTAHVNMSGNNLGSQVLLGSYLRQRYESWNCSNSGLQCTELCVATVLYHHHLFPGEFQGRISDIANVLLVHPESYAIESPGSLSEAMQFKMTLNQVPDAQHKVECRTWNPTEANWTTDGCTTEYGGGNSAICNCTELRNVTVFKIALPVVTTLFPPSTTPGSSPTSQGNMNYSISSPGNQSRPTTSPSGNVHRPVVVSFKFPVDYHQYSSRINELKTAIIDMLSTKLNISRNRIVNLDVKPGSIIVSFTLLNNTGYEVEGNIDSVQKLLVTLANNGTLSLIFDGTVLTADAASLKFAPPTTEQPPAPKKKEETSNNLVIIIAVLAAVIVAVVVLILAMWYVKKRQRIQKSENLTSSSMLFADNIKLQERDASPESMGADNQRYIQSPNEVKRPLTPDTETPPQSRQRVVTPIGSRHEIVKRNDSPGAMVSVGIGSSASLKKSVFTD